MEFTAMPAEQAKYLKPVLYFDLNYIEGLDLLAGELGQIIPVIMNRITKHVFNPLILQAYLKDVTIKQIPIYMVSVPLELEIIAAIACNGGLDAFLCPYPIDTKKVITNFLDRTPEQLATIAPPEYIADLLEMSAGEPRKPEPVKTPPAPSSIPFASNIYDIPTLSLPHQPAVLPKTEEWQVWGSRKNDGRTKAIHFYTDDKRFNVLASEPEKIKENGASIAIECNFSMPDDLPGALAIAEIWKKRSISRRWQAMGLDIVVDLNVSRKWLNWNLEGIPQGWTLYANRAYANDLDHLQEAFELACNRAGTNDITYLVYGRKEAKKLCESSGWLWIDSAMHTFGN